MIKIPTKVTTPHGLEIEGTVWRWLGLQIDAAAGTAQVVLCGYPSREVADLAGTPQAKLPLAEVRVPVSGADFLQIAAAVAPYLNAAIYGHVRDKVPMFVGSEDIG